MRLEGKVAINTGSASGIGRGMALALAKEGAHVAIVDINEEMGHKTLAEVNQYNEGMLFIKDISKRENIEQIVSGITDKFGKVDILINNTHASKQALFTDSTQEMFVLSFGSRYYPTFHSMQVAYLKLKKTKGKEITFASGAGLNG